MKPAETRAKEMCGCGYCFKGLSLGFSCKAKAIANGIREGLRVAADYVATDAPNLAQKIRQLGDKEK